MNNNAKNKKRTIHWFRMKRKGPNSKKNGLVSNETNWHIKTPKTQPFFEPPRRKKETKFVL